MQRWILAIVILCVFLFPACNGEPDNTTEKVSATDTSVVQVLKEAYIYGLPLVVMDITKRQMTNSGFPVHVAPNTFKHNSSFPDAKFRNVVRPNADTYYSMAWLELNKEPIVLSVPDTRGRYYMMPMMDAYSNVFASPGTRTTGNKAGNFLITGPQWNGQLPDGMQEIKAPTNTVWLIGRIQVNSKEDGDKNVIPLQKQCTLIPLSAWGKPYTAPEAALDTSVPKGDPNAIVRDMPADKFFDYVNSLLAKYPPPAADKAVIDRFAAVGIGAGKNFDLNSFTDEERTAIAGLPKQILKAFDDEKNKKGNLVNGWNPGHKVIGTYGTDYTSRAIIACFGLGANLREDAIYPSAYFDAEGMQLNGSNKYVLHFNKGETPPANAFWSLTMYDGEGYFIDNPINRYTLGDRSNLKTEADGSINIYIQKDDPGNGKTSNWLPAPAGDFNLLMRVYWPKEEMLKGTWQPPGVMRQ